MAEVLVEFNEPVADSDGITYTARACGSEVDNGHWQGWIEFRPTAMAASPSARDAKRRNRIELTRSIGQRD